ncbi:hydrogenase maturation protein [Limibacter armeniacum]|uniref:hydrogenase maturation protein n=1 Tax=Limibacter armeniacum TaxID=466084 RepID=UPI002FE606E6
MKILLLVTAFNGLSQRVWSDLRSKKHDVEVLVFQNEAQIEKEINDYIPDLIVAPYLKSVIPSNIYRQYKCLIVHPGIKGDRGPSSLDWAIMKQEEIWGVTIVEASKEMDAGNIWASRTFPMRDVSKSNLYRHEVAQAATECVAEAIEKFITNPSYQGEPLDYAKPDVKGELHPAIKRKDRKIDWLAPSADIIRKIKAGDSNPGVLDNILGEEYFLFGAHLEGKLKGKPKEILAQRHGAICIGTKDGAIWISHLKKKSGGFKLPATVAIGNKSTHIPHAMLSLTETYQQRPTFKEIKITKEGNIAYLHFDFYNGAMGTDQCRRLIQALKFVKQLPVKVVVLMGDADIWSNGIHLNLIENALSPAEESWANINAMNDLVREVIITDKQITISAMQGNAGAGGAILALAADYVFAREGVVLNPHYKKMGLFGSEYWTYLLPKRVGPIIAEHIIQSCEPISAFDARQLNLINDTFGKDINSFVSETKNRAISMTANNIWLELIRIKHHQRKADEKQKPLAEYRKKELERMYQNFFDPESIYHTLRHQFVHKISCGVSHPTHTPEYNI